MAPLRLGADGAAPGAIFPGIGLVGVPGNGSHFPADAVVKTGGQPIGGAERLLPGEVVQKGMELLVKRGFLLRLLWCLAAQQPVDSDAEIGGQSG